MARQTKRTQAKATRKKTSKKKVLKKKDERIPKIFGAMFLVLGICLSIAFISYIFTWQTDQDKVLRFSWGIFAQGDLVMANWLGRLGAMISNLFFYWGFGVSSFFFVAMFVKLGTTLMAKKPMVGFWDFAKTCVLGIAFTSITLEFALGNMAFPWGGAFGESTYFWLSNFLGNAGLFLLLLFSAGAFFIWKVNPDLQKWDFNWSVNINMPAFLNFKKVIPSFAGAASTATPIAQLKSNKASKKTIEFEQEEYEVTDESESEDGSLAEDEANEKLVDKNTLEPTFLEKYREGRLHEGDDEDNEDGGKDSDSPIEMELDIPEPTKQKRSKTTVEEAPQLEIALADEAEEIEPVVQATSQSKDTATVVVTQHVNHDPSVSHAERNNIDHSEPYDPKAELSSYTVPTTEILEDYSEHKIEIDRAELESNKDQIIETLLNYKIEITKIRATIGPTVTLYEIIPAPGVRISKIKNLEDDIALSLSALGIRIIAPMPGKGTIGIEVPNQKKQIVSLKEVLNSDKFDSAKMDLPVALGKTISNEVFVADLAKMPHLLVAGATGQGKSVGINTILMSLLYKKHPSQLKLVLIDPKKVELFPYSKLDKHFLAFVPDQEEPIITDTKKVIYTLNSLCIEMDQRYDLLKTARSRNIREYNDKFVNRKVSPKNGHRFLPYIVLVIDEFADLIMTAGKEVELPIGRLAQLARAVGIHLIIATQRPSVNIITGVIKANFPARLAFKVTSKVDSRTILDAGGAEQLIGRGDMLLSVGSNLIRLQCAFVDTPEVEAVIDQVSDQQGYPEPYYLPEYKDDNEAIQGANGLSFADLDAMFEDAARLVVQNQHGSTSMIQRRMKLGYNRAGRIMDQLEAVGIVGQNEGSKAREVLVINEMELDHFLT
jgi:S-DNA-T family DNA segregation ATPase FtsK/SpoIIIE